MNNIYIGYIQYNIYNYSDWLIHIAQYIYTLAPNLLLID